MPNIMDPARVPIIEAFAAGKISMAEAMAKLGVSRARVNQLVRQLGLSLKGDRMKFTKRPLSPHQVSLLKTGRMTTRELAEHLGLTLRAVYEKTRHIRLRELRRRERQKDLTQ